jgi:hypothetical protein
MNISFLSIVLFMIWMLYLYFVKREGKDLSSDMLYLSVSFMGLIIAPIFNVLNAAVTTNEILGEGCKQKLSLLDLRLILLQKQQYPQEFPGEPLRFWAFREAIAETIGLIDKYPIPQYRFFYLFDITPELRDRVVAYLSSMTTAFILGMVYNFTSSLKTEI